MIAFKLSTCRLRARQYRILGDDLSYSSRHDHGITRSMKVENARGICIHNLAVCVLRIFGLFLDEKRTFTQPQFDVELWQ